MNTMADQYSQGTLTEYDVVRSTQFVDDLSRPVFRGASAQPQRIDQSQIFSMPYSAPYHQQQNTIPWQSVQPVYGSMGGLPQSMYNPYIGTPVTPSNAYNNHVSYPAQPRDTQFDGTTSGRALLPQQNRPQGAPFGSPPSHAAAAEYYTSGQVQNPPHESTQPRTRTQCMPVEAAEGQTVAGLLTGMGQGSCGQQRETHTTRDTSGGRVESSKVLGAESARPAPSTLGRQSVHTVASAHTSSEGGTLRDRRHSLKEPSLVINTNNSPTLLSPTSSKSSPPSTLSQRKQLRVEEKSYLKEVKRSIAEGRVPQVRLEQNHNGAIVKYKAQFLNALKLAALAIVPCADIDIKNPCTMQEIMREVKRQFIIEKPLPDGMVEGYLQRLYKRNRSLYHRQWLLHGDSSRPDDCSSAAWLQLVDYWKSSEGSRECERNKANASTKKGTGAKRHSTSRDRRSTTESEGGARCSSYAQEKAHPKENPLRGTGLPRLSHTSSSSKISSSDGLVERPPMLDISNKLHALVDEFVSNLSSECDSLANIVCVEAHKYVAHDSALTQTQTQRPSNRTTSEVLKGLTRPSTTPLTTLQNREGKSHVQPGKPNFQAGNKGNREEDSDLRYMKNTKAKSAAPQELDDTVPFRVLEVDIEVQTAKDVPHRGGRTNHTAARGRPNQPVELLSSDSTSDESPRARAKQSVRKPVTQFATKGRDSTSQRSSRRKETRSPSWSPESSHLMNYSYEEDTAGLGGTSPHGETTFPKLRWPADLGDGYLDGGSGQKSDDNDVHSKTMNGPKHERLKSDVDISLEEGDESNGEDTGRDAIQTESDGEELPVLPKVPVKRKVANPPKVSERRTQRGNAKSTSPSTKRQRTPQMDASVITQLSFARRPPNSSPIRVRVKVWVLHPKFDGKVVAEAYAGINHKSRCLNDEQDLCKKGEQMISVIRVFYKDTPVMFKKEGRYPKHIAFLDQAEGLPNSPILWGVCYIMQIPTMEEITRLMGKLTSAVCGRASSNAVGEGPKGKRTNSPSTTTESLEAAKPRDSSQLRKKTEQNRPPNKKGT